MLFLAASITRDAFSASGLVCSAAECCEWWMSEPPGSRRKNDAKISRSLGKKLRGSVVGNADSASDKTVILHAVGDIKRLCCSSKTVRVAQNRLNMLTSRLPCRRPSSCTA